MSQSAVQKFIDATRALFAVESDSAKRWQKMPPLLEELLANPALKEQSKTWPDCSQGSARAENLLFYEDPDYKFVINGLIKAPIISRIRSIAHIGTSISQFGLNGCGAKFHR